MGVFRALGGAPKQADGTTSGEGRRTGKYGEQYVYPVNTVTKHQLSDEGSYFVVTNPTPGTGVAFAVNASSDFTKSLFLFKNNDNAGGKRCYLDYVKVIPTVAPASATAMHLAVQIDAPSVNRYTSGATLAVGVNVNGDDAVQSIGTVYYATSAVITTAAAGSAVRLVHRSVPRSVIPAVADEIIVSFGPAGAGGSSGTAAGSSEVHGAPLIVGPQEFAVFNVWFPSNAITALSYEFEFAWSER